MKEARETLIRVVRRSALRRRRAEALAVALTALSVLALAGAVVAAAPGVLSLASHFFPAVGLLAAFLFASAVAALSRLARPVRERVEAKRLDDALGLKDRLSSAVDSAHIRVHPPVWKKSRQPP